METLHEAGVLIGIEAWGWPWHGIIRAGVVGGTNQPHTQPASNVSWLIDQGLAAISTSQQEQSLGMEWRNYALIPGGRVYGTYIGDDSFIHMDEAGDAWLVSMAYSFPASQTFRITSTITRFGLFDTQEPDPVVTTTQKVIDVTCVEVELLNAVSQQQGAGVAYGARFGRLEDVWTNGSKALISVVMSDLSFTTNELFSVITLSISGVGGTDGSGLVFSGTETITQPNLTTGTTVVSAETLGAFRASVGYVSDDKLTVCPPTYTGSYTANFQLIVDGSSNYQLGTSSEVFGTVARYAYFNLAGVAKAIRLRVGFSDVMTLTPTSDWSFPVTTYVFSCQLSVTTSGYASRFADRVQVFKTGWWLLENNTIVDSLNWQRTTTSNLRFDVRYNAAMIDTQVGTNEVVVNQGSLAAYLPNTQFTLTNSGAILNAFKNAANTNYTDSQTSIDGTTTKVGIHRMASKAVALLVKGTGFFLYGDVITPKGNITAGISPSDVVNFAWDRKTSEHVFDTQPVAYV